MKAVEVSVKQYEIEAVSLSNSGQVISVDRERLQMSVNLM